MTAFVIFVKKGCPYCKKALANIRKHKATFTKVVCKDQDELKTNIKKNKLRVPSITTFPRVYKGTKLVGGSDDLEKLLG